MALVARSSRLAARRSAVAGRLTVATCQFAVGPDVRRNAAAIRRQMRAAHRRGAEIVHFPEAALSGYAGSSFRTFDGYPWETLAAETRGIRDLAAQLGLWTLLGSTHPNSTGKPYNCLYLIDPRGRIAKRYDKSFLIPRDERYYEPGRRIVTHALGGIRFGLLICFDFRFPEIWREHLTRRCRLIFLSSYQAGGPRVGLMRNIAPATLATRASESFLHVVASNTCGEPQWYNARVHRPDGSIACQAPWDRPFVLVHTIDLSGDEALYNPIGPLALRAARGARHS